MINLHKEVINIGVGAMSEVEILKSFKEEIMNEIQSQGESLNTAMELHSLELANRIQGMINVQWEKWYTVCECITRCE